ncbi:T9SS type A sorting domain-containing protein [Flavobacterium piscinae]|nr:T9SS type A sorting domain-containing protein [Flavobacterium piscinae]MBC8883938.1 T9SS type A sorting domain-containing protein [Flavobacterium piscinae]
MLNASHQYNVRKTENQLVWNFFDIDLPPTIENAQLSQGFVHFKIKPKPGFEIGDVIENTAEIYFDYNPPIITNTSETEFVENLSLADFSVSTMVLYPNPVKDSFQIQLNGNDSIQRISIFDMVGKRIYYKENLNLNSNSVDVSSFNHGIYLVEVITTSNQKLVNKIIKQ